MLYALSFLSILACVFGCFPDDGATVVKGKDTTVCLLLSGLKWGAHTTWNGPPASPAEGEFLSIKATLKADEFSVIKGDGAWNGLRYGDDSTMINLNVTDKVVGNGLGVSLGSIGIPSFQKAYRRVDAVNGATSTSVTFPVLMAVIRVDEGKVKEIIWDDTCEWCESSSCSANTYDYSGIVVRPEAKSCYIPDIDCVVPNSEYNVQGWSGALARVKSSEQCSLKVYVTWTGTDANGFHFLSAASRFSRLSETQVKRIVVGEEGN